MTRAVPLRFLPVLMVWTSDRHPDLFRRQEVLGLELAAAWDSFVAGRIEEKDLKHALALWALKLREASRMFQRLFLFLEPIPLWAFWTLFTRKGESESGLSRFLREEVGYPTDEQAGMRTHTGRPDV